MNAEQLEALSAAWSATALAISLLVGAHMLRSIAASGLESEALAKMLLILVGGGGMPA
jgi:hypothetical protein